MQTFWFHHQTIYRRGLWLALASILLLGLTNGHSGFLNRSSSSRVGLGGVDWQHFRPTGHVTASMAVSSATTAAVPSLLPPYGPLDSSNVVAIAKAMSDQRFGSSHWPALNNLWSRESGWRPGARNGYSGACGIPQALPCSKITDMSPVGQIDWGLNYIASRYGNPTAAWHFWQIHHWY